MILMHLRLDLSSVSGSPLAGQVGQRAMTRSLELTVRHGDSLEYLSQVVVKGWVGGLIDEERGQKKAESRARKKVQEPQANGSVEICGMFSQLPTANFRLNIFNVQLSDSVCQLWRTPRFYLLQVMGVRRLIGGPKCSTYWIANSGNQSLLLHHASQWEATVSIWFKTIENSLNDISIIPLSTYSSQNPCVLNIQL